MAKLNTEAMDRLVTLHQADVDRDGLTPVFLATQAGGLTRTDTFGGADHFVVQTVAVISKVLNGELLPANELSLFVEAWNGRPVPLRHPQVNGLHVSANDPSVLEEFNLGFFFNCAAEPHDLGVKLVGEMWLDIARINEKGGPALEALTSLQNGGTVEVSTAYFCLVRDESGEHGGEHYDGVQHNIKPDHIALLPDQVGACSIADGCGVNTNAQEAQDGTEDPAPVSNVLEPGQRAMVGVWLSQEAGSILRLEASSAPHLEPVQDLHITLAYLGEGDEVTIDQQALSGLVDYMTGMLYTHTVQLTGTFRFFSGGELDAVGYLADGETLNRVRQIIVDELQWMGQSVSRPDHWVPHVTLGYTSAAEFQVPAPGVGRFGVSALTVAYGDEVISFPLRGEVGSPYLPMNQANGDQDMSEEQKNAPCGEGVTGNEDGASETPTTPVESTEVAAVIPEDVQAFMDEVNAAGGVAAIVEALGEIKSNSAAKRAGAVERIKAHTAAYADADLDAMPTEALVQLADVLGAVAGSKETPAANYAAKGGNAGTDPKTTVNVEGLGELRAFSWDDGDK